MMDMIKSKKNVYINQINNSTTRNLLPLAAGMIASYAKSVPEIQESYSVKIEIERRDPLATIRSYIDPDVVAFSCYSWNLRQNLELAMLAKQKWPACLIVFGGPSAPLTNEELASFSNDNSFVDIVVHGEGEITFSEILLARIEGDNYSKISGITCFNREKHGDFITNSARLMNMDINKLPSPFLDGTFDDLLKKNRNILTGSLWETTRGCPFSCTYCSLGKTIKGRLSEFRLDRLSEELRWISKNSIYYVYIADANFGMMKKDISVAETFAGLCKEKGYPKFFMVNWMKNSSERVLDVANVLREGNVDFHITISMQSFTKDALKAIKRKNIDIKSFDQLVQKANNKNYSTYTDLIIGLPNDTYDKFVANLGNVLKPFLNYHFAIYLCRLLIGSEMATKESVAKYKIETRKCLVKMGRREALDLGMEEYEDIVVSNSTLSVSDWKKLYIYCYFLVVLFNFRLGYFVFLYLKDKHSVDILDLLHFIIENYKKERCAAIEKAVGVLKGIQKTILNNKDSVTTLDFTGSNCWDPHEAMLLTLLSEKDQFYVELRRIINSYLLLNKIDVNNEILQEIFKYQIAVIPVWGKANTKHEEFNYDIPSYFSDLCGGNAEINSEIRKSKRSVSIGADTDYWSDPVEFARARLIGGNVFDILDVKI
jgi:putative methyltransferase